MLDAITPAENDVDVTLLYQTGRLEDIRAGPEESSIKKGAQTLFVRHLAPEKPLIEVIPTAHYINTLKNDNPLIEEGMLAMTSRTAGNVLVMANLLTTLPRNEVKAGYVRGEPCGFGTVETTDFMFSTEPGRSSSFKGVTTDALAAAWNGNAVFAAVCTFVARNGIDLLRSKETVTCEIRDQTFRCYLSRPAEVTFGLADTPRGVFLDGKKTGNYRYDGKAKAMRLKLPAGESVVAAK